MNEEQLRAAITQAITDQRLDVVNELTPLLQQQTEARGRSEAQAAGQYVPDLPNADVRQLGVAGQNIGQAAQDFGSFARQQAGQVMAGQESVGQGLFNVAAKGGLGVLNTVVGEGIQVGIKGALVNVIPNQVEEFVANNVKSVMTPLLDNPATRAGIEILSGPAGFVKDKYMQWKEQNPNDAASVEGAVNVAEWLKPPAFRGPVPDTSAGILGRAGDKVYETGRKIETKATRSFLHDLITPLQTTEVAKERAKRKTANKWGTLEYTPTPDEEEVVSNLMELELKDGASFTENGKVILQAVEKKHNSLDARLKKANVDMDKNQLILELEGVADAQDLNPALVGDAKTSATKIFKLAEKLIKESDGTALGILNVRRQIDKELAKLGKGNYDGNKQNGIDIAKRAMRNHLNLKVAEAVPDVNVKKDLRKMHLWLRAADDVYDKAGADADLKIGRMIQNAEGATGTQAPRSAISKYVAGSLLVSGIGGITLAGYLPLASVAAGAGAIAYAVKRGAVSPSGRKALGALLRDTDKALKATKNSAMRKAIAADRAFVVELMKLPTTQAEDYTEEELKGEE